MNKPQQKFLESIVRDEEFIKEVMQNYPEYNEGNSLHCIKYDYENCQYRFEDEGDNKVYNLNLYELRKGLNNMRKHVQNGRLNGLIGVVEDGKLNSDPSNWDALAVDALVQCAIFGEVIYG